MQQIDNTKKIACRLVISKLDLLVYLGCRAHEKKKKQVVSVTVEINFKDVPAGIDTDEIEDTVCYSKLIHHVQNFVENKKFNLVEKLSKDIYECVCLFLKKRQYSVSLVKVTIHKTMSSIKGGVFFTYGKDKI